MDVSECKALKELHLETPQLPSIGCRGVRQLSVLECQADGLRPLVRELKIMSRTNTSLARSLSLTEGSTPLHQAAKVGELAVVRWLVDLGTSVHHAEEKTGYIPLHVAAAAGHLVIVKYLLNCGSLPNTGDSTGRTALHLAIIAGHVSVVDYLSSYGPLDPNIRDLAGQTALHLAISHTQLELALHLCSITGVERATADHQGQTPLALLRSQRALEEDDTLSPVDKEKWTKLENYLAVGNSSTLEDDTTPVLSPSSTSEETTTPEETKQLSHSSQTIPIPTIDQRLWQKPPTAVTSSMDDKDTALQKKHPVLIVQRLITPDQRIEPPYGSNLPQEQPAVPIILLQYL